MAIYIYISLLLIMGCSLLVAVVLALEWLLSYFEDRNKGG